MSLRLAVVKEAGFVGYSARGNFEGERMGTAFPLLKCRRTHKNGTVKRQTLFRVSYY